MAVAAAITAGAAILSFFGSRSAASRQKWAMRENAADLRSIALDNAASYKEAGDLNASAVLNIGEANAVLIERETVRNMQMYALQADEDRRQHVLSEKQTAGSIRAMVAGSGVQANTGTPLHYLHAEVKLGIQNRRYGDLKTYWSLKNMWESGEDRAEVTRFTAGENARVIRGNAAIQAERSLADAERQAAAMDRGVSVAGSIGNMNAMGAIVGGIGSLAQQGFFTPQGTTGNYMSGGAAQRYGDYGMAWSTGGGGGSFVGGSFASGSTGFGIYGNMN